MAAASFSLIVIVFFWLKVAVLWRPKAAIMSLPSIGKEGCIGGEAAFIRLVSYRREGCYSGCKPLLYRLLLIRERSDMGRFSAPYTSSI